MIAIEAAADADRTALCAKAGVEAQTALQMRCGDELLGFVLYTVAGDSMTLVYLDAPDEPLTDALLRAALNAGQAVGAKTAQILYPPLRLHMENRGYLAQKTPTEIKIADFFSKSACKG